MICHFRNSIYLKVFILQSLYFNQDDTISSLKGKHLILVEQFTYFGSSISSTESDVNIYIGEVCIGIDRWTTI